MPIMRPTGCRSATVRLRRGNDRRPTRSAPAVRRPQEPRNLGTLRRRGASEPPADAQEGPVPGAGGLRRLRRVWVHERRHARRKRRRGPAQDAPQVHRVVDPRAPVLERQHGSGLGFGVAHQLQAWRASARFTRQTSDSFREGGSRRTPWSKRTVTGLISATSSVRITHPCRCPLAHKVGPDGPIQKARLIPLLSLKGTERLVKRLERELLRKPRVLPSAGVSGLRERLRLARRVERRARRTRTAAVLTGRCLLGQWKVERGDSEQLRCEEPLRRRRTTRVTGRRGGRCAVSGSLRCCRDLRGRLLGFRSSASRE
jgi:hypothetical protein